MTPKRPAPDPNAGHTEPASVGETDEGQGLQRNTGAALPHPSAAWLYQLEPNLIAGVVLVDEGLDPSAVALDAALERAAHAVTNGTLTLRRLSDEPEQPAAFQCNPDESAGLAELLAADEGGS